MAIPGCSEGARFESAARSGTGMDLPAPLAGGLAQIGQAPQSNRANSIFYVLLLSLLGAALAQIAFKLFYPNVMLVKIRPHFFHEAI